MIKLVHIDVRNPRNKEERGVSGNACASKDRAVAFAFVNAKKHLNSRKELIDTIFHEMTHALLFLFRNEFKVKVTAVQEEKIAQRIGRLAKTMILNPQFGELE